MTMQDTKLWISGLPSEQDMPAALADWQAQGLAAWLPAQAALAAVADDRRAVLLWVYRAPWSSRQPQDDWLAMQRAVLRLRPRLKGRLRLLNAEALDLPALAHDLGLALEVDEEEAAAGGDSTRRPHGHVLHYQLHAGEQDSGSTSNWAFLAGLDTQFPFASRREEEGPVVAGVINNDDLPLLVVVARLLQGQVRMLLRDVANLRDFFGRFAPELLRLDHGGEIWDLYQRGILRPDTVPSGAFQPVLTAPDVSTVLRVIDDARAEEAARRLRMQTPV